ncbi:MAG: hypothetical protein H8D78_13405 [Chloroflexi bacterium]|nr:hypothetical protein [Chloroflexota bacterium]
MKQYTTTPPVRHRTEIAQAMAQHEGLVHWVVHRQWLGDLSYAEALQAGRMGLWRALQGYDPRRGTALSTYAVPAIARAIWRAVARAQPDPQEFLTPHPPQEAPDPEEEAERALIRQQRHDLWSLRAEQIHQRPRGLWQRLGDERCDLRRVRLEQVQRWPGGLRHRRRCHWHHLWPLRLQQVHQRPRRLRLRLGDERHHLWCLRVEQVHQGPRRLRQRQRHERQHHGGLWRNQLSQRLGREVHLSLRQRGLHLRACGEDGTERGRWKQERYRAHRRRCSPALHRGGHGSVVRRLWLREAAGRCGSGAH